MKTQILSRWTKASATAAMFALALAGPALAADFSADVVTKMGPMNMTGKVYVKGDKVRQETKSMMGEQIVIMRPDKKVSWILIPAKKQYSEVPNSGKGASVRLDDSKMLKVASKKSLGKQTISGIVCDKYQYVYKNKSQGTCTQWVSKELAWPVKTEMKSPKGSMVTECKNIKKGKPADKLFEIPKGYKKAAMNTLGKAPAMPAKRK